MGAVERELPEQGSVLEIGCGHGMFCLVAALGSSERSVVGADIDAAKLVEARRAANSAGLDESRVSFLEVAPDWRPPARPQYAAVVILDVLYLLGIPAALELTAAAARAVAPGGRLLIKEMDTDIRWKARVTTTQEFISTRLTRVTEGETNVLVPLDDLQATMEAEGLTVTRRALDRHYLWPHALLIGTR
jgi:cyclopropane fatty-acyl-phospholipid synthase-like methyltransferase